MHSRAGALPLVTAGSLMSDRHASTHRIVHGVLLALAAVLLPVLTLVGVRILLESRDGEVVNPVLDPELPGYQALVAPSPTLLAVHTDAEGQLVGVALLAMAGDEAEGGSVILIPPATMGTAPNIGELALEYVQVVNGVDATHALAEVILRIGVDDAIELDHDTWAALTEPLEGLTLSNPDPLDGPEGVVFPAGEITLAPDEVGIYLAWLSEGENPLNRLLRQELVWRAWLDAVGDDPSATSFPGEQDRGLARFVPAIAAGVHRLAPLPITPAEVDEGQRPLFLPDEEAIAALVARLVPFPAGARPGDRPLVRLVDASGRREVLEPASRQVALGGGQVVMIGNAEEFGAATTEILIADEQYRAVAESVAEELGVGSVQVIDYIDESVEIIVMIGLDYSL